MLPAQLWRADGELEADADADEEHDVAYAYSNDAATIS